MTIAINNSNSSASMSILSLLPYDILNNELRPRLDNVSRLCVRVALGIDNFKDIPHEAQLEIVQYDTTFIEYFMNGKWLSTSIIGLCAEAGLLAKLAYFHNKGYSLTDQACDKAIIRDNADCLQYLVTHLPRCSKLLLVHQAIQTVQTSSINCVKLLVSKSNKWNWDRIMLLVIRHDRAACLEYFISLRVRYGYTNAIINTVTYGSINCMKYFTAHGKRWTSDELSTFVRLNHLSCVKFLYEECHVPLTGVLDGFISYSSDEWQIMHYLCANKAPLISPYFTDNLDKTKQQLTILHSYHYDLKPFIPYLLHTYRDEVVSLLDSFGYNTMDIINEAQKRLMQLL